jgi:hypothetical protein
MLQDLWKKRSNVLRVTACSSFSYLTYLLPFVMMNSFVPLVTDITFASMMALNTVMLCIDVALIPLLGLFLCRFQPYQIMLVASGVLAITIFPFFSGLVGASFAYVTFVRLWVVLWGVVFMTPVNLWFRSLFHNNDMYLLVGMGNAIGAATVGRLSTPICLWLWYTTNSLYAPALYMAVLFSVPLLAIGLRRGKSC